MSGYGSSNKAELNLNQLVVLTNWLASLPYGHAFNISVLFSFEASDMYVSGDVSNVHRIQQKQTVQPTRDPIRQANPNSGNCQIVSSNSLFNSSVASFHPYPWRWPCRSFRFICALSFSLLEELIPSLSSGQVPQGFRQYVLPSPRSETGKHLILDTLVNALLMPIAQ